MELNRKTHDADRIAKSENDTPVEEVPRTNTGVKIDNPEEMEKAE
ncbi:MAG: hypothetical protein ABI361_08730 [Nitrososphaera sp.]|jgi:hypothetical protein